MDLISAITSLDPRERSHAIKSLYDSVFSQIEFFVIKNGGNKVDAEDVFQDGLVALYHNLSSGLFRQQAKVETYLYSICRRLWMQQLRKSKRSDDFSGSMEQIEEEGSEAVINISLFQQVFAELKEDCQELLIKFYYHQKSIKAIRETLNVQSDQAVKNKKSRCMKYLLNLIKAKNLSQSSFFE